MNYELAKELKDAGFPILIISKYGQHANEINSSFYPLPDGHGDYWKLPTLSELIEACPKEMNSDIYDSFFSLSWARDEWYAMYDECDYTPHDDLVGTGSTPEEAVARLWLALNKK